MFHTDSNGSVLRSGDSLDLAAGQKYDPFGQPGDASPDRGLELGYRGEITIDGQVHLRARTYDPTTGLFTSEDPLEPQAGDVTASNWYAYANNDPLNLIDPHGASATDDTAFSSNVAAGVGFICKLACKAVGKRAGSAGKKIARGAKKAAGAAQLHYRAAQARRSIDSLKLTSSAAKANRPYQKSKEVLRNVMKGKPMRDPQGAPGAVAWRTPGTYNGTRGHYELVVQPAQKRIVHFLFKSSK